jgi:ABC-type polysaccharide/polyol phosphate transport system ATPase subunit
MQSPSDTPSSRVHLQDVSVRFRYVAQASGLKEAVLNLVRPPAWKRALPAKNTEFWGLRNINLDLREGDRLGIIGRNGAGKSTLLKVISRIYRPTSGSISVIGRIAPLIEIGAGFNPELSGRENAYLNGAVLGLGRKQISGRLDSIVNFSELKDFIDMPVKYYSTGMHMKLAFTLATEIPPDILILDELYAGGDAAFIQKANTRLESFVERSRILILVAHSMEYINHFCTRVIVLDHGRIVGEGAPHEMTEKYLALCSGDNKAFEVSP